MAVPGNTDTLLNSDDLRQSLEALGVDPGTDLAVAVSGGADSLCLAILSAEFADVTCLTVDHGLRAESAAEAATVARLLAGEGVPHQILRWDGEKPNANIQAEARLARYRLMAAWCRARGIGYLLTGHHQDDQAETLLLRLARGSGVYGLAAMAPVAPVPGQPDISLVRPLLDVPKARLEATLLARDIRWIDDPSNEAEKFDRVKVRRFLKAPILEGFQADRLAATANRLRRTRDALEYYERDWLRSSAGLTAEGNVILRVKDLHAAPLEIVLRGLASICRTVSGQSYVPRMEKLERALDAMQADTFGGQTLYGAQFVALGEGQLMVCRELAAMAPPMLLENGGMWDNRFEIFAEGDTRGLELGPLGQEGWSEALKKWPTIRETNMPFQAKLTLPAVFDGGELVAIPLLQLSDRDNLCIQLSHNSVSWAKKC